MSDLMRSTPPRHHIDYLEGNLYMLNNIKIYRTEDFIRKTEKGKVDIEHSLRLIDELAEAAEHHVNHNILLDLREYEGHHSPADLMKVALEFTHHRYAFRNKMAVLIPNTEMDIAEADYFQAIMKFQGFQFETFIDYEDAIDWLSTITSFESDDD